MSSDQPTHQQLYELEAKIERLEATVGRLQEALADIRNRTIIWPRDHAGEVCKKVNAIAAAALTASEPR